MFNLSSKSSDGGPVSSRLMRLLPLTTEALVNNRFMASLFTRRFSNFLPLLRFACSDLPPEDFDIFCNLPEFLSKAETSFQVDNIRDVGGIV